MQQYVKLFRGVCGLDTYDDQENPKQHAKSAKNTIFLKETFLFFVSIFLACLTAVAGVKRFVLLFSGRLYSKID